VLAALSIVRARISVATLLMLYGVALWLFGARSSGAVGVTIATVLAFAAGAFWLAGRMRADGEFLRVPLPAGRAIVVFAVVTVLAYVTTLVSPPAGFAVSGADRTLVTALSLCGVALAAGGSLRDRRQVERLLGALVGAAAIVAVFAFVQYRGHYDVARHLHVPGFGQRTAGLTSIAAGPVGFRRVAATASSPAELGIALVAALPLALHLAAFASTARVRIAAALAAMVIAGAIPLAWSRAALWALLVVAVLLLPSYGSVRRLRVVIGAFIVAGALLLVGPGVAHATHAVVVDGDHTHVTTAGAWDAFGARPVLGHGLGVPAVSVAPVDDQYLTTAVETGLVGLLAFLGVLGAGLVTARRARRATDDPAVRDLAQSLLAVIGALAVGGFFANVLRFPITAGLLFLAVGTSAAVRSIAGTTPRARPAGFETDLSRSDMLTV
jgi:polysaccharide biosynthesis protein PslJ